MLIVCAELGEELMYIFFKTRLLAQWYGRLTEQSQGHGGSQKSSFEKEHYYLFN
jgi:hypothetical protein